MQTAELVAFCDQLLASARFRDSALNGLQVEGRGTTRRLACAVSVSQRVIEQAIAWGADTLLVHHGLFWGERAGPISGVLRQRLARLLRHDLALIAYHLPLDAHPELGNNAQLAHALGLQPVEPFAEIGGMPIGCIAQAATPPSLASLVARVRDVTGREPLVLPGGPEPIERLAIVSGAGAHTLPEAAARGCAALLTGEAREPSMALARELGVTLIAAGHEATERLGVQALSAELARHFGLATTFLPDPNPV
jgi:dinuclear metal center YbgI/SA1388 family protein